MPTYLLTLDFGQWTLDLSKLFPQFETLHLAGGRVGQL
jgi:hypothetical protein